VPAVAQDEVKAEFWKIFDDIDAPPGQEAVDVARGRIASFEKRYGTIYPVAVKCLTTDVAGLTVCLRFPGSASPPLQLHRAHLRRDQTPGEGHRSAAR
jgi:hypothetical protein